MASTEEQNPRPINEKVETKASYSDEKLDDGKVDVAESIKGDVYDDGREIDLDETGKERPIGEPPSYFTPVPMPGVNLSLPRNGCRRRYSPYLTGG